jgi:hypothetical protein
VFEWREICADWQLLVYICIDVGDPYNYKTNERIWISTFGLIHHKFESVLSHRHIVWSFLRVFEKWFLSDDSIYCWLDASTRWSENQNIKTFMYTLFFTSMYYRQYKMAAKEYIYREFANFGMEVEYFTFDQLSVSTKVYWGLGFMVFNTTFNHRHLTDGP